jgi:hypothetical protein
MAKTTGATLITDLAKRLDLDSTDATTRTDMLRQLNISQHEIVQAHSLKFLADDGTLTLTSTASSVAVPTGIDTGKAMTLGRADGKGSLKYIPLDEWYQKRRNTYGSLAQTEPNSYTIINDAGTETFLFDVAASGGSKSIPYIAQKIATAIADSSSTSILPEGWEDTLLLTHAEAELRRLNKEPLAEELYARANDLKERLYSSYRTTKEQQMTDREQEERKVARENLAPEK